MFLGTYQNKIDDKNRMAVPAKFRDQLGGKCMLTKGFDECLYIYTMEDFEVMAAKIAALPQSDADFREFIRDFFGNSSVIRSSVNWTVREGSRSRRISGTTPISQRT